MIHCTLVEFSHKLCNPTQSEPAVTSIRSRVCHTPLVRSVQAWQSQWAHLCVTSSSVSMCKDHIVDISRLCLQGEEDLDFLQLGIKTTAKRMKTSISFSNCTWKSNRPAGHASSNPHLTPSSQFKKLKKKRNKTELMPKTSSFICVKNVWTVEQTWLHSELGTGACKKYILTVWASLQLKNALFFFFFTEYLAPTQLLFYARHDSHAALVIMVNVRQVLARSTSSLLGASFQLLLAHFPHSI